MDLPSGRSTVCSDTVLMAMVRIPYGFFLGIMKISSRTYWVVTTLSGKVR